MTVSYARGLLSNVASTAISLTDSDTSVHTTSSDTDVTTEVWIFANYNIENQQCTVTLKIGDSGPITTILDQKIGLTPLLTGVTLGPDIEILAKSNVSSGVTLVGYINTATQE
jgi:hypothetical protein